MFHPIGSLKLISSKRELRSAVVVKKLKVEVHLESFSKKLFKLMVKKELKKPQKSNDQALYIEFFDQ